MSAKLIKHGVGSDLASAREFNRILLATFDEQSIFHIDHYLGKRPVMNMLFVRFVNSFLFVNGDLAALTGSSEEARN